MSKKCKVSVTLAIVKSVNNFEATTNTGGFMRCLTVFDEAILALFDYQLHTRLPVYMHEHSNKPLVSFACKSQKERVYSKCICTLALILLFSLSFL